MTLALDLDGTLLTCRERQSALMRACAAACDERLDAGRYWNDKREGADNLAALARQDIAGSRAAEMQRLWIRSIEDPAWLALDRLQSPLATLAVQLRRLRPRFERVALVTARRQGRLVAMQLRRTGLAPLFDAVAICDPAQARSAKRAWFVGNGVRQYIGDSESDAEAARGASADIELVANGQRSGEFLLRRTGVRAWPDVIQALESLA